MKISIVIPTKDRYWSLKKTILFLEKNKFFFDELIIVDSSLTEKKKIENLCNNSKIKIKLLHSRPSISLQRNLGLKKVNKTSDFVMFLDDDIIFYKNSLIEMKKFLKSLDKMIIGVGFNLITKKKPIFLDKIKKSKLFEKLNLYSSSPGRVVNSGWHTIGFNHKKNINVQWLPTCSSLFRTKFLKNINFDVFFSGYSYLEDLDFSYRVGKLGILTICAKAKYVHKNEIERSSYNFGKREVVNRYYFVLKNKLNFNNFLFNALLRSIFNLLKLQSNFFFRFCGNIYSLVMILLNFKNKKNLKKINNFN